MVTREIPVNHKILRWARIQANLSPANAVSRAGLKDLKPRGLKEGLASTDRLQRWEEGVEVPTLSQLEKLAKAYRRPLLTFFMPDPPAIQTNLRDFRTVADKSLNSAEFSPEFSALVRREVALQVSLHDLLENISSKPLSYVSSLNMKTPPIEAAQQIRDFLGYTLENQKRTRGPTQVFSDIRNVIEEKGVFVLLEGNLGSYHTNIDPEVFRGLSISDQLAPLIVVNPNDAKTATVFTLIHEFCHILLGETGISNINSLIFSEEEHPFRNEVYCNRVAAEFLVPQDSLLKDWEMLRIGYSETESIEQIAQGFNVSRLVIARRLFDFNRVNRKFYWEYFNECQKKWENRESPKNAKIPYKIRIKSRLGNKLIHTVIGAAAEGKISCFLQVGIPRFCKINSPAPVGNFRG